MPNGEEDDRITLLNRAREGDEAALNKLLDVLRPEVRSYLEGQLQSHPATSAQAEELTQEVLVRIARSVESCEATTGGELWSWVTTIARNARTDRFRKRKREMERRTWDAEQSLLARTTLREVFGETAVPEVGEEGNPLDTVLGRILLEAQGELSEGTREVVRRKVLLHETWRDTGAAIGTSGSGAKRRWQRAIPRLRREVLARLQELPKELRRPLRRRLGLTSDQPHRGETS